jgi:hypothetical protein
MGCNPTVAEVGVGRSAEKEIKKNLAALGFEL